MSCTVATVLGLHWGSQAGPVLICVSKRLIGACAPRSSVAHACDELEYALLWRAAPETMPLTQRLRLRNVEWHPEALRGTCVRAARVWPLPCMLRELRMDRVDEWVRPLCWEAAPTALEAVSLNRCTLTPHMAAALLRGAALRTVEMDRVAGVPERFPRGLAVADGRGTTRAWERLVARSCGLRGGLDAWLLTGLKSLDLSSNELSGNMDLTSLPAGLTELTLSDNQFTGNVDLASLPEGLIQLALGNNKLSGRLDLTSLPAGLQQLFLGVNELTGSLDLSSLPAQLTQLSLDVNQFTGNVNLKSLPPGLTWLSLSYNELSGWVDLTSLPSGLQWLALSPKQATGPLDRESLPAGLLIRRANEYL